MPCVNHPEVETGLAPCARCGGSFCPDCVVTLGGKAFCAECKGEQVRDIQSGADATALDLASIGRRFAALFVDGLLCGVPISIVYFMVVVRPAMEAGGEMPFGQQALWGVILSVPAFLYDALMVQARGQTLGKMALKIKVVTPEGRDVRPGQAWGRAAVRVVFNNLSALSIVNYLAAFFGKEKACVHDRVARTRVINWRP